MGDANAGVYVGVAVLGVIVVVVVVVLVVACCWYTSKRGPGRTPTTVVEQFRSDTRSIKSKAKKLKAEKSPGWACCRSCCVSTNNETDTGELEPPVGLHVLYSDFSAVTVSWKPPDKPPPYYSAVRVQVFRRLSEEGPDTWTKVGTVKQTDLQYRMRHKDPDISCHIGVATKCKSRKSSIVERELIYTPAKPPGIPVDFKAYEQPDKSVLLTWRLPAKAGRYGITVYDLMVKDGPSSTWSSLARVKPNPTVVSYKAKNRATWSKRPVFRVAAENSRGKGPYVESGQVLSKGHVQLPPRKPSGHLQYSNVSHNSVTLSWQPPPGGDAVNEYIVERREVADGKPWKRTGISRTTSYIAKKLPNSTEMIFQVIATNEAGSSEPLIGAKFKTKSVVDDKNDTSLEERHSAARSETKPVNKPVHKSRDKRVNDTPVTEPIVQSVSIQYEKQKKLEALNKKRSVLQEKPVLSTANKRLDDVSVLDTGPATPKTEKTDNSALTLRDMTVHVRGVAERRLRNGPLPEPVQGSENSFQTESTELHFTEEPIEIGKTETNDTHVPKPNTNRIEELNDTSSIIQPNDSHVQTPEDTRSSKLKDRPLTEPSVKSMRETPAENVKEFRRTEDDLTGPQTTTSEEESRTRREGPVLPGQLQQPSKTRYRHNSYLELK